MKQHIDHYPTIIYDISIDSDDRVSLRITYQDPEFKRWLQNAPFTEGPLKVQANWDVLLDYDHILLCGTSSDIGKDSGISHTLACGGSAYEYVNKVKVSISMAIAAFRKLSDRDDTNPISWDLDEPEPITVGSASISWDNMGKDLEQIGFHFGEVVILWNSPRRMFAYIPARDMLYMSSNRHAGIECIGSYKDNKDKLIHAKKHVVHKECYVPVTRDD